MHLLVLFMAVAVIGLVGSLIGRLFGATGLAPTLVSLAISAIAGVILAVGVVMIYARLRAIKEGLGVEALADVFGSRQFSVRLRTRWPISGPPMVPPTNFYESTYGHFSADVREEIWREVYGRDIGQNSWLTAEELERFAALAGWSRETRLLEIGCGSGGPALFLAQTVGLAVTGLDISAPGIAAAAAQASASALGERVRFLCIDGSGGLPFDDAGFDAVLCIDAINHLPDRAGALAEWRRVLGPSGVVVYTDPVILTGAVTHAELAERSAIGYFLFVPPGENERFLRDAGFELLHVEDVSENEAAISARRMAARERRRDQLMAIEDAATFESTQRFLATVHALASRRALSRFVFIARKVRIAPPRLPPAERCGPVLRAGTKPIPTP